MDRKNNRTPIVGKIFLPKVWGLDWNNIFVSFAFICLYNDWISLSLTWDKWPRLCVSECATRGRKSGPKASSSFQSCVLYRDGQKKREKTLGPYTDVNRKPQVSIKQENGNASNRGNSRLRIDIYNTDLSLICTHMGAKKNLISLSLCVIHKSKYIESFYVCRLAGSSDPEKPNGILYRLQNRIFRGSPDFSPSDLCVLPSMPT